MHEKQIDIDLLDHFYHISVVSLHGKVKYFQCFITNGGVNDCNLKKGIVWTPMQTQDYNKY